MNNLQLSRERKAGMLKRLEHKYKSKIGFSTQEGVHIVSIRDILYLRAVGNYTEVYLLNGKMIMLSKTLKIIEKLLPETGFKRCHQSYVVNLEEVRLLQDSIFLSNEAEIPISRRKKNEFKTWFLDKVAFL